MADEKTFMVEDAKLIFRNFSGEETQYNRAGERNFCVILDEKTAHDMANDGWNVKTLASREEGEPDSYYIQIAVGYKIKPPRVTLITSNSRTPLHQDSIGMLDWVDILTCDFIAHAYDWEVGGKRGIKAYLRTMFITIQEDALERKYGIQEV